LLPNLSSYDKLDIKQKSLFFDSYIDVFRNYIKDLEDYLEECDQLSTNAWRNSLKIYIFFTEWLVETYLSQSKSSKKEIKKGRRKIKDVNAAVGGNKENNSKGLLNTGKSKKKKNTELPTESKTKATAAVEEAFISPESVLKPLLKLIMMNIKLLFRNKIIEEDLLNSIIKISFDILEYCSEKKITQGKERIFEILQFIVTKYQSNVQILLIKLTTKIVNLIYNQEALVSPLSEFVVLAINGDSNMNKLGVDILHEVSKIIFEDESMDSQGLKNVSKFLIILSEKSPKTMYNNISTLIKLFSSESYTIRNTLVEVLANVIIHVLCNLDDINEVDTRNNYLKTKEKFIDILFDRIYDKSGYCRSKVLNVFEKLCESNTISVNNYLRLLKEASGRLKDEKAQVRKRALALINKIICIYAKIFRSERFLTHEEVNTLMQQSENNIKDLTERIEHIEGELVQLSKSMEGMDISEEYNSRKNDELEDSKQNLKDERNKEQVLIEYLENYKVVLRSIESIIPIAIQLLGSKNTSDVLETIDLFIILHKLRVRASFEGVKKMLNLIIKSDESVKKRLIESYQEIYFHRDIALDIQAANLIDVCINLNHSEFTCLRELLKYLIQSNNIDKLMFREIWKIYLRNPDAEITRHKLNTPEEYRSKLNLLVIESRAALQILNLAADYDNSLLLSCSDIFIKSILTQLQKPTVDWLMLKECILGLRKIHNMKKDIVEMCLIKICKSVIKGYGTDDNNWYIAAQELIEALFSLLTEPETISQYLIIKLSRPLFVTSANKDETAKYFMSQNIESAPKFTQNTQQMDVDGEAKPEDEISKVQLSQLIFLVGHIAINMVMYVDKIENTLKKRKGKDTPSKMNKSQDGNIVG
jgi:condensin complex subunit 1